jgi:hypothetical protein
VKKKNNLPEYVKYSSLGIQFLVIVLIGFLVGSWLDNKYEKENNIFTFILTIFMTFVAIYHFMKTILKK